MKFNNAKLRGRIVEIMGTQARFAAAMGMSEHTASKKISGQRDWKQHEILLACSVLGINDGEISSYFFTT